MQIPLEHWTIRGLHYVTQALQVAQGRARAEAADRQARAAEWLAIQRVRDRALASVRVRYVV